MKSVRSILCVVGMLSATSPLSARSQAAATESVGKDSVVVEAGSMFRAGNLKRRLWGDNYRDVWTTRVKVPVLDLRSFKGGLTPTKTGGGKQGKSLRFVAPDSSEYVFRPILKTGLVLSDQFKHTIIWSIFRDQGSASHPTSAVAADPLLGAAGVLHPSPIVVVMPDDTLLGEFRKEFAGVIGMIEEYPNVPKGTPGFGRALEIIDSDSLLERLNRDPQNHVDARAFLTATLMDILLGDNDRHPGQWKWARLTKSDDTTWVPIPRDRDKDFVSFEGMLLNLARRQATYLVTFDTIYPDPVSYFRNSVAFHDRILERLDKSVWDSLANNLVQTITDSVIDGAVRTMPPEYAVSSRRIAEKLKVRRNRLPAAASRFYAYIASLADVHGTDEADRAIVNRSADGIVDVSLQSGANAPYFTRHFEARDTREIRLYLHDGDDDAIVTGNVRSSILVRIIGGNGNNTLVDSSTVASRRHPTLFYDVGNVTGVKYARDTIAEKSDQDLTKSNYFNRRPWLLAYGTLIPPVRDRGRQLSPVVGLKTGRGLGLVPRIGVARYVYGFRTVPYSNMWKVDVAYATTNRFALGVETDKRFESSDVHIPAAAGVSQLDVVEFRGFGNDVPNLRGRFYKVKLTQWQFRPAVGVSLSPVSEISLGPIVRYAVTDSLANRFISETRPYGFGHFGEVGAQLKLHFESRYLPDTIRPRATLDVTGSGYPGTWDAKSAYESLAGVGALFLTLPLPKRPVLALRGGGKKLFGNFPYFDAAFLGGLSSLRTEHRQQFAGDASLYGTTELRVPVAQFPFILPLDVGLIGFAEAGRVYLDGESPGGWHSAQGAGFWVGVVHPGTGVNVLFTNSRTRRTVVTLGFAF